MIIGLQDPGYYRGSKSSLHWIAPVSHICELCAPPEINKAPRIVCEIPTCLLIYVVLRAPSLVTASKLRRLKYLGKWKKTYSVTIVRVHTWSERMLDFMNPFLFCIWFYLNVSDLISQNWPDNFNDKFDRPSISLVENLKMESVLTFRLKTRMNYDRWQSLAPITERSLGILPWLLFYRHRYRRVFSSDLWEFVHGVQQCSSRTKMFWTHWPKPE